MILAIFACTFKEAIISVLTERDAPLRRSLNKADAEKDLCARWSRTVAAITETLDLSLVAFWGEKSRYGGSTKALNLAKLATLRASLLLTSFSLSDCSSTRDAFVNAHTHHGQSEGGPHFTISDWFRPRYKLNVFLLLNHIETFWVAETCFSFLE